MTITFNSSPIKRGGAVILEIGAVLTFYGGLGQNLPINPYREPGLLLLATYRHWPISLTQILSHKPLQERLEHECEIKFGLCKGLLD